MATRARVAGRPASYAGWNRHRGVGLGSWSRVPRRRGSAVSDSDAAVLEGRARAFARARRAAVPAGTAAWRRAGAGWDGRRAQGCAARTCCSVAARAARLAGRSAPPSRPRLHSVPSSDKGASRSALDREKDWAGAPRVAPAGVAQRAGPPLSCVHAPRPGRCRAAMCVRFCLLPRRPAGLRRARSRRSRRVVGAPASKSLDCSAPPKHRQSPALAAWFTPSAGGAELAASSRPCVTPGA